MARDWTKQLDELKAALAGALGEKLVALLLYGSAARRGDKGKRPGGDVNLLLIVQDGTARGLRAAAEPIDRWVSAGHPAPLVFEDDEFRGSADVFPIEIEDMREAHRLLLGRDPFAGLATRQADLRAELEREVLSKLLHLRTAYAAAAGNGRKLGLLLEHSSGAILTLLRAALRVAGKPVPADDVPAQVRAASALVGCDPAAFDWVLARRSGGDAPKLSAHDERAERYVDAVQKLAAWVNGQ